MEYIKVLRAESYFKDFDGTKILEWAKSKQAENPEAFKMLLENEYLNKDQILQDFKVVLKALKQDFDVDKSEILHEYVMFQAQLFKGNTQSLEKTYLNILKVAKESQSDFRYKGFLEIEEDLERIYLGKSALREGLSAENQKKYIEEELKLFLAMERLNIPIQERKKEYCLICGQLTVPILKRKYQIRRPFTYHVLCCEHCNSERLKPSYEHFVKRKIIESQL